MKFGGTSVGDAERIRSAARIIGAARGVGNNSIVAVVSAMGGVTNLLIETARACAIGDGRAATDALAKLRAQHATAAAILINDADERGRITDEMESVFAQAESVFRGVSLLRELSPRSLDLLSGVGERSSARLVAGALRAAGFESVAIDATELIVTDDRHTRAEPLMTQTRERVTARLRPLLAEGVVPVVTGFIGATRAGVATTLGRGGSDYSATILGASLDADEVIIWTDVDGVMTADPRLVSEARTLDSISYAEAAELAYFGAKVLHPKTLRPVVERRIPVAIRDSSAPELAGTTIRFDSGSGGGDAVKAITSMRGVSLVTVGGAGFVGVPGVAAKTFAAVASVNANVLLISQSSSENDICFIIEATDADATRDALRGSFDTDLARHAVDHITIDSDVAIVAAVGEGMRGSYGVAGRIFGALGRERINVMLIAQGSSEYNVSFVVAAGEMRRAVLAVHTEFDLANTGVDKRTGSHDSGGMS